jgi:vacuolar-type H+-ATPase subunit H
MTDEQQSLLQKIRHRELEISVEIDRVRREADRRIEETKKEAADLIRRYEEEADRIAVDYRREELERIGGEIERLKEVGESEARKVRERGERNLPQAIDNITKTIAPG